MGSRGGSALILCATLLVFSSLFSAQFTTWDDLETVGQNPRLETVSWSGVAYYWQHPAMDLYIPLTYTVWGFLASLPQSGGSLSVSAGSALNPALFHGGNVLLHALAAVMVCGILRRLLRNDLAALLGALFFAVHPLQVEAVAWVSGLKDVLSGLLVLCSLYCHIRNRQESQPGRARRWLAISTVAFVLALLAKPAAMVTPVLVFILDVSLLGVSLSKALRRVAAWILVAVADGLLVSTVQPATHLIPVPIWKRPLVAGDALMFQMRHLVLPLDLSVDYGRTPQRVLSEWTAFVAWIVPATVALLAWTMRRRLPLIWTGVLLFVAAQSAVLGLVGFDFQRYSTVTDHYLYVAMIGPALIVGALAAAAPRWVPATMAVVLIVLGVASRAQTESWQDGMALYTRMVAVNPQSFLGHNNLGYELVATGRMNEAIPHYEQAIRLFPYQPGYRDANFNLAWVRERMGDRTAAIAGYREAVRIDPKYLAARQNLAAALAAENQLDASLVEMRIILQAAPASAQWHANTGAVLARLGRIDEAIREYEEALRLQPGFAKAQDALRILKQRL